MYTAAPFFKAFIGFSTLAAMAEVIPDPSTLTTGVEHLSLVGVLLTGVVVLWRANGAKDNQIIVMQKAVAEALALSADATRELRTAVTSLHERLLASTRRET